MNLSAVMPVVKSPADHIYHLESSRRRFQIPQFKRYLHPLFCLPPGENPDVKHLPHRRPPGTASPSYITDTGPTPTENGTNIIAASSIYIHLFVASHSLPPIKYNETPFININLGHSKHDTRLSWQYIPMHQQHLYTTISCLSSIKTAFLDRIRHLEILSRSISRLANTTEPAAPADKKGEGYY